MPETGTTLPVAAVRSYLLENRAQDATGSQFSNFSDPTIHSSLFASKKGCPTQRSTSWQDARAEGIDINGLFELCLALVQF